MWVRAGSHKPQIRYKGLMKNYQDKVASLAGQKKKTEVQLVINLFQSVLDGFIRGEMKREEAEPSKENILDHTLSTYQVNIMQSCDQCGSYIWGMEKAFMCCCTYLSISPCYHPPYDGDSSSLQFGVRVCLLTSSSSPVPTIIEKMLGHVEMNGLYVEGIYRKAGSASRARELHQLLDSDLQSVCLEDYPIHTITSLVKKWLRELPEPLMTFSHYSQFLRATGESAHPVQVGEGQVSLHTLHRCGGTGESAHPVQVGEGQVGEGQVSLHTLHRCGGTGESAHPAQVGEGQVSLHTLHRCGGTGESAHPVQVGEGQVSLHTLHRWGGTGESAHPAQVGEGQVSLHTLHRCGGTGGGGTGESAHPAQVGEGQVGEGQVSLHTLHKCGGTGESAHPAQVGEGQVGEGQVSLHTLHRWGGTGESAHPAQVGEGQVSLHTLHRWGGTGVEGQVSLHTLHRCGGTGGGVTGESAHPAQVGDRERGTERDGGREKEEKLPEKSDRLRAVYRLLEQLPPAHFNTLERLFFHLVINDLLLLHIRVAKQEVHNRMSPSSLAIVFAPCLLRSPDNSDPFMSMADVGKTTMCVEMVINEQVKHYNEKMEEIEQLELAEALAVKQLRLRRQNTVCDY
ncbi:hypothetical protein JZ751_015517 [Albula glossodonta]|uniref:Rho-GAP domain-containing protein n=1 Tax=Albula glossodonta TaxID=121402 RepID=A0A8T2MXB2_9TELE|nr:hypothetical protein JZ751_015517 [Albula glossodonta]